jgi:hypothetical protein
VQLHRPRAATDDQTARRHFVVLVEELQQVPAIGQRRPLGPLDLDRRGATLAFDDEVDLGARRGM